MRGACKHACKHARTGVSSTSLLPLPVPGLVPSLPHTNAPSSTQSGWVGWWRGCTKQRYGAHRLVFWSQLDDWSEQPMLQQVFWSAPRDPAHLLYAAVEPERFVMLCMVCLMKHILGDILGLCDSTAVGSGNGCHWTSYMSALSWVCTRHYHVLLHMPSVSF